MSTSVSDISSQQQGHQTPGSTPSSTSAPLNELPAASTSTSTSTSSAAPAGSAGSATPTSIAESADVDAHSSAMDPSASSTTAPTTAAKPKRKYKKRRASNSNTSKPSASDFESIGRMAVKLFSKVFASSGMDLPAIVGATSAAICTSAAGMQEPTTKDMLGPVRFKRLRKRFQPKRPASAYAIFLKFIYPQLAARFPDNTFQQQSKQAGAMWNSMTDEQKQQFHAAAEQNKIEHAKAVEAYTALIDSQFNGDEAAYLLSMERRNKHRLISKVQAKTGSSKSIVKKEISVKKEQEEEDDDEQGGVKEEEERATQMQVVNDASSLSE